MSRYFNIAAAVVLGGLLAACDATEPGFVAKQWSQEMRELQINPVFPPREDFQVGDVYLPAVRPADSNESFDERKPLPLSLWLTSLDTDQALKSFYETRRTYPATTKDSLPGSAKETVSDENAMPNKNGNPDENGTSDGNEGADESGDGFAPPVTQPVLDCSHTDAGQNCNIFTDRETTALRRMRIVGFPTFLSTNITKGDLSAFVPAEAFTAALGASFGDVKSVSVSVPVAESIGLPAGRLLKQVKGRLNNLGLCGNEGRLGAFLPPGQRPDGDRDTLPESFYVVAVSEVFYTRAIDVSVHVQGEFGFGAQAQPTVAAPLSGKAPSESDSDSKADDRNASASSDDAEAAAPNPSFERAQDRLDSINKTTAKYQGRTTPGASIKFLSVTDGSIGMRRSFARPIAIGYRGLELRVRSSNCKIVGGGPEDTSHGRGSKGPPIPLDEPAPAEKS